MLNCDRIFSAEIKCARAVRRILEHYGSQQERKIAGTSFAAAVDSETFWSFKFTINDRRINLKSESLIDLVCRLLLEKKNFEILPGWIHDFVAFELKCSEMRELLAQAGVK